MILFFIGMSFLLHAAASANAHLLDEGMSEPFGHGATSWQALLDLLEQPPVSVGIAEACEGGVTLPVRIRAGSPLAGCPMENFGYRDPAVHELVARGFEVGRP
jgi:hypothetical protein